MLKHALPSDILSGVANVQRDIEKFKLACPVEFDRPLAEFTTFRVGGPADVLARPRTALELQELVAALTGKGIPFWVLGGGANVVVSDRGVRGVVIATGHLDELSVSGTVVRSGGGVPISDVSAAAADHELSGLEFIYAMPGSAGGAVWMNARCYDGEIAGILHRVEFVTREGASGVYLPDPGDFGYKISPFQDGSRIITAVEFALTAAPGRRGAMWDAMRSYEDDRRRKGHFALPCAGSIFKNDRRFGRPSGRIIDEVGLRGRRRGGAMVSEGHGNIIVNTGDASAEDIRTLTEEVQSEVFRATGFHLDPEVLFVGDWAEGDHHAELH
jgi:UDP-N-acetylmuramate dehydrogenase